MTTEQIGELARHFKIDEASIVREYVQLLFLRSFYALKESRHVFFKGGTAIHFHYSVFPKTWISAPCKARISSARW